MCNPRLLYLKPELKLFSYFEIVRDVRQNKGSILRASVEYIKLLKADQVREILQTTIL